MPESRTRWPLVVAAVASILVAAPGVHAFELVLPHLPAVLVSHGIAVAGLVVTWRRWRAIVSPPPA